jgi:energy-coupling factor transporter ATP-binding protein EcfA2
LGGSLVVLTGASGTGKTTIALEVERAHPDYEVFRFDSIGVPSAEVMATFGSEHQPGGAWQRAMTLQWFERIAPVVASGRPVLFEGQMRIAFIREALSIQTIPNVHVILVECEDSTRDGRLIDVRRQPELANDTMKGWSRYLHSEAVEAGIEILDTGEKTLAESVAHILMYLNPQSEWQ